MRDIMNNFKQKFMNFMRGRYGVDILSRDLVWITLGIMILNMFLRNRILNYIPLITFVIIYARMFSKNYSKRYNENRIYTNFKAKFKNPFKNISKTIQNKKQYKVFKCPNCKQKLRVPRGKKEIVITCSRCKTKFDAKS